MTYIMEGIKIMVNTRKNVQQFMQINEATIRNMAERMIQGREFRNIGDVITYIVNVIQKLLNITQEEAITLSRMVGEKIEKDFQPKMIEYASPALLEQSRE